jgi:RNA polymerase sigma-54 factor
MALSAKLVLRQGQTLILTPQLLQAIKLLQFSSHELSAFVDEELERNPMLERGEERGESEIGGQETGDRHSETAEASLGEPSEADWSGEDGFAVDQQSLEAGLGTELSNAFDAERIPATVEAQAIPEGLGLSASAWSGGSGGGLDGEAPNLEAYVAARQTLAEFLGVQLALAVVDPADRLIGQALIDSIDEAGYLGEDIDAVAGRLGVDAARVARMLGVVQSFEPSGVGARDLAECLAIQLRENDRFDPAMARLVANLPLLARRDFAALRRICEVDEEDLADMVGEIRRLEPKPGRAFGGGPIQPLTPDVTVRAASDGSWLVELNADALPRVLVNNSYAAQVMRGATSDADKTFVSTCLQDANWLTKSLEQRARTILKVATEIVRQQDAFLVHGVAHLRPLNLKAIAEAIGMHESTVSRVTSNKYMATPRGLFEMKYFFTAAIAAHDGGETHSAEAVRHRIRLMIEEESVDDVLSDDAIVVRLKAINIDIARRTVAKYRESLRIPSSVERRREKAHQAAAQRPGDSVRQIVHV